MIFEKIDLQLDVNRMKEELHFLKKNLPIELRKPQYGGWSLQSTNGSYKDGLCAKIVPYNGPHNQGPRWSPQSEEEKKMVTTQDHHKLTDAALPYFKEMIQYLDSKGLQPRRTRILFLAPQSRMRWHQDGPSEHYQVRLHIPIETNENSFFETEQGKVHMPADGSGYFVHTNHFHRAVNFGDTGRYHFVAFVWDTLGITKNHQYNPNNYNSETVHGPNTWYK